MPFSHSLLKYTMQSPLCASARSTHISIIIIYFTLLFLTIVLLLFQRTLNDLAQHAHTCRAGTDDPVLLWTSRCQDGDDRLYPSCSCGALIGQSETKAVIGRSETKAVIGRSATKAVIGRSEKETDNLQDSVVCLMFAV